MVGRDPHDSAERLRSVLLKICSGVFSLGVGAMVGMGRRRR